MKTKSVIYYIQNDNTKSVKIGFTIDLIGRLSVLQASCEDNLSIIRAHLGTSASETWIHAHFSDRRLAGEWFSFSPKMMSVTVPKHIEIDAAKPNSVKLYQSVSSPEWVLFIKNIDKRWKNAADMRAVLLSVNIDIFQRTLLNWKKKKSEPKASVAFAINHIFFRG